MIKAGLNYKIVRDAVGSIRAVVAPDGTIAERIDYDEFGNVIADTANGLQPFGYAGGLLDAHTGLVRFGTRDYDPRIGRWLAADVLRFEGGSTNLYSYAGQDPVNSNDPTGLATYFCEKPLDALQNVPGSGYKTPTQKKSFNNNPNNRLFHRWICVGTPPNMTCGGQGIGKGVSEWDVAKNRIIPGGKTPRFRQRLPGKVLSADPDQRLPSGVSVEWQRNWSDELPAVGQLGL